LIRHVAVAEHYDLGSPVLDEREELALGMDRNAARVELARQFLRIHASRDVRDLRRRERDHLVVLVVPEVDVEVVKVAAGSPHDDDTSFHAHLTLS
jgi:hypothetical protein